MTSNKDNKTEDIYLEINLPGSPYHKQFGKVERTFTNYKGEPCYELLLPILDKTVKVNERILSPVRER